MTGKANKITAGKPSCLFILYDTLEYDGRARRFIELLRASADLCLADLAVDSGNLISPCKENQSGKYLPEEHLSKHVRIVMTNKMSAFRRHIRFWRLVVAEARAIEPRLVVAQDYFTLFPAWLAARLCRAKLVYDAHELVIPGADAASNLRSHFWYSLEKLLIRQADLVIAANRDRARIMQRHYKLPLPPVVLRNLARSLDQQTGQGSLLEKYPQLKRCPGERLLLYQGAVRAERGLGRFIDALTYLPPHYRLIIAGGGSGLNSLRAAALHHEREGRLAFLGPVENRFLPAMAEAADVGLVAYPFRGLNNIYCASGKIYEYLQAGTPVVSTSQPPLRELVEEYRIGRLIDQGDSPPQLASLIQDVAENRAYYLENRLRFLQEHNWQDETWTFKKALEALSL